jgi:hypothetical protein
MAGTCQGGLAGARDRALLLLAASGLGRAALVGLDFEHVRITDAGAELVITDPAGGGGRRVAIKRAANRDACPVQALKDWLATSETSFGPVFRKIDRWGNIEHRRLGTDALRRILARRTLRRGRTGKAAALPRRGFPQQRMPCSTGCTASSGRCPPDPRRRRMRPGLQRTRRRSICRRRSDRVRMTACASRGPLSGATKRTPRAPPRCGSITPTGCITA